MVTNSRIPIQLTDLHGDAAPFTRCSRSSVRYLMRVRLALLLAVAACHRDASAPAHRTQTFNDRVLALIDEYPAQGFGGYAWPAAPGTAGTTRDLRLGDTVIAHGGQGNHCVGITFEVFWRALEQCEGGVASVLDVAAAEDLKRRWYVPELGAPGTADALIAHSLGVVMTLDQAQPGDFVQAWNADGTVGHSMIFLGVEGDQLRYWSSQPWTDGIGESQSALGADFDRGRVFVARAACQEPKRGR
jgi:hypothetical protein